MSLYLPKFHFSCVAYYLGVTEDPAIYLSNKEYKGISNNMDTSILFNWIYNLKNIYKNPYHIAISCNIFFLDHKNLIISFHC